jgi:hypothetical protein
MEKDRYEYRYRKRVHKELTVLSLGAGVQSSTMLLMIHKGLIPRPDHVIFADTGHEPRHSCIADPATGQKISGGVYGWLDWMEKHTGIPITRVSGGSLAKDSLYVGINQKNGNRWLANHIPAYLIGPNKTGMLGRTCTSNYKIVPIQRKIREILGVRRVSKRMKHKVTMLIGITTDEASRMKPAQVPYIENAWPLIEMGMTRQDCIDWLTINGYPIPTRSACTFCPLRSDREWIELKESSPADFAEAVEFERQLQKVFSSVDKFENVPFLHDSGKPLDQTVFGKGDTNSMINKFENECEGLCGV